VLVFLRPVWLVDIIKRLVDHRNPSRYIQGVESGESTSEDGTKLRFQPSTNMWSSQFSGRSSSSRPGRGRGRGGAITGPSFGTSKPSRDPSGSRMRPSRPVLHRAWDNLRRGFLTEVLLPVLWPDIGEIVDDAARTAAFEAVLGVLCQFEICFEVSPTSTAGSSSGATSPSSHGTISKPERRWFVPCMVTGKFRRDKDWKPQYLRSAKAAGAPSFAHEMWEHHTTFRGSVQSLEIAKRHVFNRFVMPGFIGKLLHALNKAQSPDLDANNTPSAADPKVLDGVGIRDAVVYSDAILLNFNALAHKPDSKVQLLMMLRCLAEPQLAANPNICSINVRDERMVLDITARGSEVALERIWEKLEWCSAAAEQVVRSYVGLLSFVVLPCPRCVQELGPDRDLASEIPLYMVEDYWANLGTSLCRIAPPQRVAPTAIMGPNAHAAVEAAYSSALLDYFQSLGSQMMTCEPDHLPDISTHHCPVMWLMPPSWLSEAEEHHSVHQQQQQQLCDVQEQGQGQEVVPQRASSQTPNVVDGELCTKGVPTRAVVQIGLYYLPEERFIQVGTGFVVDKEAGIIVTSGHLVALPSRPGVQYYQCGKENESVMVFPAEHCKFVVGMYTSAHSVPVWTYTAEVFAYPWALAGARRQTAHVSAVTPAEWHTYGYGNGSGLEPLAIPLNDQSPPGWLPQGHEFVDALILHVDGACRVRDPAPGTLYIAEQDPITQRLDFGVVGGRLGEVAPCPLPAQVKLVPRGYQCTHGEKVSLLSYPARVTSLFCFSESSISIVTATSVCTPAFQDDGSSGGPLALQADGSVIGIMSRDTGSGMGEHVAIDIVRECIQSAIECFK
jgi:hypothetical protein